MSGYYSEHASEYIASTINADMSSVYALFEPLLLGKKILDVGFGSGRDMLYFKSKGYEVIGIDTEPEFVKHAQEIGLDVVKGNALTFRTNKRFDGIWACASLLHLNKAQIEYAILNLKSLLEDNGLFFVSLKEGDDETVDEKGRTMTFVNETFLKRLGFHILSITDDINGRGVRWINAAYSKPKQALTKRKRKDDHKTNGANAH